MNTAVAIESNVGSISVWQEFILAGKTYKRVGLWGYDNPARSLLYDVHSMPDAETGKIEWLHQNSIVVQEKTTGAFYVAECSSPCRALPFDKESV